jgi:hypothetical protein
VITDDEVLQLFEQADPARALLAPPPLDAGAYLDTLRLRGTDMTLTDIAPSSPPSGSRNRRFTVAAVIVVALLIAGSAIALFVRSSTRQSVTHQPPHPPAMQVATDFVAAYTAYDADAVSSLLAGDADVSGMYQRSDWRLGLRFMQATGLKVVVRSCVEEASSPTQTLVRCPFVFHALGSDEVGLGPFPGGVIGLTIRDGKVVDAETNVPYALSDDHFKRQMWQPFASWVATNFPDDAAVMYTDHSHIAAAITEESIPLWEQHTRDYVNDLNQTVAA